MLDANLHVLLMLSTRFLISASIGADLINWMMKNLDIEDQSKSYK